jgi:hypothetical protein
MPEQRGVEEAHDAPLVSGRLGVQRSCVAAVPTFHSVFGRLARA